MDNFIFENYVSLGYFCSIAEDLGKLGLRRFSQPFDWNITSLRKNIQLLSDEFKGFMQFENLSQNIQNRSIYKDRHYDFYFYHDFSKYKPLSEQYDRVKDKYDRRISRLLESIQKPTLFIRYISDKDKNGISKELKWIEQNFEYINEVLKKFNSKNEIIYISNSGLFSEVVKIYQVEPDKKDSVARSPLFKSKELLNLFNNFNIENQTENLLQDKKRRKKNNVFYKLIRKVKMVYYKIFFKVYKHENTYTKEEIN